MSSDTLPTTRVARGKVVGKAMLRIGARRSTDSVKMAFLSDEQRDIVNEESHRATAKIIMESLGELKGISVKLAQQVALSMPFLPQSYLDEIGKSFQSVPPINRALVRKIVRQELGNYPDDIFDEFDSQAFGSASLGQVHLALVDDQKLAIKIQYPGVAHSIKSDLSLLRFALGRFAKGKNVDHIIDEISDRVYEEVDYRHEASNHDFFYRNFKHPYMVIPKIHRDISTDMILSSTYIDGVSLNEFLSTDPSQELRDHYGQLLFNSFFISLYELKRVHADPNPGNFIFMDKMRLGLIDFGCVKEIDDEFLSSYTTLHLALIDGVDDTLVVELYRELGMIDDGSMEEMLEFYRAIIKPLDRIYIEIFMEDSYSFKEHRDYSKRGFEAILKVQREQIRAVDKFNQEYLFIDRTLLGYYAIFEKLEATIDSSFAKIIMRQKDIKC